MGKILIELRLDDYEGMEETLNLLSGYINNNRVTEAKARHCCDSIDTNTVFAYGVMPPTEMLEPSESPQEAIIPKYEVDSAGEPWDPDKHSASKSKLKDGTWRLRRNSKPKEEDKPVPPPPGDDAEMAEEEVSYKAMMEVLKGKGMSLKEMNELAQRFGVNSIGLIISRTELIPKIMEAIK